MTMISRRQLIQGSLTGLGVLVPGNDALLRTVTEYSVTQK